MTLTLTPVRDAAAALAARAAAAAGGVLMLAVVMLAAGWLTWQVLPAPSLAAEVMAQPIAGPAAGS